MPRLYNPAVLKSLLVSLRPHQWTKNVFVLAPLAFSQGLRTPETVLLGLQALVSFICASSAVYLLNDIVDRKRDRLHPVKRERPIASGRLSVFVAGAAAATLTALSFWLATSLGQRFLLLVSAYLLINVVYSLLLKHLIILDVMTVSLGFVIRVAAGAAAIDVEVSNWLLLCTIFFALLLSCTKRRHEILLLSGSASDQREVLAQYSPQLLDQLISTTSAATLLCYALYAVAPETIEKFDTGVLVYTVPFVIFGVFRYLFLVYQVQTRLNPTEAVLRDLPSMANVILWMAVVTGIVYLV